MALTSTAFFQIVPVPSYSKMNSLLSCTLVACCSLPIGAVALVLLALALPNGFPHHADAALEKPVKRNVVATTASFLWEADVFGAFLLLGTVVFLVVALEEGGTVSYAWGPGLIIASFIVSGVLLTTFLLWQWWAGRETTAAVPSFPRSFTHNRVLLPVLL